MMYSVHCVVPMGITAVEFRVLKFDLHDCSWERFEVRGTGLRERFEVRDRGSRLRFEVEVPGRSSR